LYNAEQTKSPTPERLVEASRDAFLDTHHFLSWVFLRYGPEVAKEQAALLAEKLLAYSRS
jgi:hypothetical protein